MAFLTGRVTCLRFRFTGPCPHQFTDEHLDRLRDHRAERPGAPAAADGVAAGWSAGDSVLDLDFKLEKNVVNDALCFDLRVDTDRLPQDLLKGYTQVELAALARDNPSGFASAKQKREAKEIARDRLVQEAKDGRFRKRKCVPVMWDRTTNEVLFGATSLAQADRFTRLFEETFGAELVCLTSGSRAAHLAANCPGAAPDPAKFVPGAGADVAWIADVGSCDWLGNEFLLWLWYVSDVESDTVKLADGSEVTFMFARDLQLACPRGQTGADAFRHEGPTRLPEARRAAQAGKLPRKAGLTLVRHGKQFDLALLAETLGVTGAKLPADEESDGARARLEQRVADTRELLESLDVLYLHFVELRLSPKWAGALDRMQRWLARDAAAPKADNVRAVAEALQDFGRKTGATVEVRLGGGASAGAA